MKWGMLLRDDNDTAVLWRLSISHGAEIKAQARLAYFSSLNQIASMMGPY